MSTVSLDSTRCLAVALTGGIASGKTTVARQFEALDVPTFDADAIARELVAPGKPALEEIVSAFGRGILTPQGELDRQRMRRLVFNDEGERRRLEAILHPRVRSELRARVDKCTATYCVLAIPLFAESGRAYDWVDRVLVVDIPSATQIARLMQRDGMTMEFAKRALAAQASREQRLALADDVIDNGGRPDELTSAVLRLHRRYSEPTIAKAAESSFVG